MMPERYEVLLSARDKARTAAPGVLTAMTVVATAAIVLAVVAAAVFIGSTWVKTEALSNVQGIGGRPRLSANSYAYYVGGVTIAAALLVLGGVLLEVAERTRAVLVAAGGGLMVFVGLAIALMFRPGRADLQDHFGVGEVGSQAEFARWAYTLDALGLLIAACGVAAIVLLVVQRRRVAAQFPG